MRMRHYWLTGLVVALVAFVSSCPYLVRSYPEEPGVRWANVRRIEVGMTQAEVEVITGRPPQTRWCGSEPITDNSPPRYQMGLMWSDTECDILVYLDRNGRVIGREGVGGRAQSWYSRLRKGLGGL